MIVRSADVIDGTCDVHVVALMTGLSLSLFKRVEGKRVANRWAPFQDLYAKVKGAAKYICNDKNMFDGELRPTDSHYVATIGGGKNNVAAGMGTVKWTWKDDNGKSHTMLIHDVLYFPSSPVNILSVTSLAEQLNDNDGTGIDTKQNTSQFYWN